MEAMRAGRGGLAFEGDDHPGYGQAAIEMPDPVGTPPDGWCFYYCWCCWLEPSAYLAMARLPSGHLKRRADQKRMLAAAKDVHEKVLACMRSAGDEEAVRRLSADPSDLQESDLEHFAAAMGCSVEISADGGFAVYGSPRRVGLRVRRYQSRDGAGHLAWHYDIEGVWQQCGGASASSTGSAAGGARISSITGI